MSLQLWLPLNHNFVNQGLDPKFDYFKNCPAQPQYAQGNVTGAFVPYDDAGIVSVVYEYVHKVEKSSSIACWVMMTSDESNQPGGILTIGTVNTTGESGMCLYRNSDHSIAFRVYDKTIVSTSRLKANVWYHIIATVNAEKNIASLYVNNVLEAQSDYSSGSTAFDLLFVGGISYDELPFNGRITDMRMFDHELSAKEREDIARGLTVHYKLNVVNDIDVCCDSSGFGHDAETVGKIVPTRNSTNHGRYANYCMFNGSIVTNSAFDTEQFKDSATVSFWADLTENSFGKIFFSTDLMGLGMKESGIIQIHANGTVYPFVDEGGNEINLSELVGTGMHMYTITFDGTDISLYIDAKPQGTLATYVSFIEHSDVLYVGSNGTKDKAWADGMSDFRVYTTVLSQRELIDLYSTPVFVDNHNNFHTFELVED